MASLPAETLTSEIKRDSELDIIKLRKRMDELGQKIRKMNSFINGVPVVINKEGKVH